MIVSAAPRVRAISAIVASVDSNLGSKLMWLAILMTTSAAHVSQLSIFISIDLG